MRCVNHGLRLIDPLRHLAHALPHLVGEVDLGEQTGIVPAAWVDPGGVDVRDCGARQLHTGLADDVRLDRQILALRVFDRGGRFNLDHAPCAVANRQQHVGQRKAAAGAERGLEDGPPLAHGLRRGVEHCRKAEGVQIDQRPLLLRVVEPPGDVADRQPRAVAALRLRRVLLALGRVHFEPQAARALAKRHEFGFGQGAHDGRRNEDGAMMQASCDVSCRVPARSLIKPPGIEHARGQSP
ncbi:MAG: hypothetical protein ACP5NM_10590 [Thiomonas sp.]